MSPNRPKKAPIPPDHGAIREGVARAVEPHYQEGCDDDGLGSVGRQLVGDMLDDESDEEERSRRYVKFPPHWRALIRWFDEHKLATWKDFTTWLSPENFEALKEIVADHRERQAMRRFWARIYRLAAIAVPLGFAWAQGFFDKALPVIRAIGKALQGGG